MKAGMTRHYRRLLSRINKYPPTAVLIGALCLIVGIGAGKGFAAIESWSTTPASNTSSIGTEGMSENAAPSTVNDSYRAGLAELAKLARQGVLATFSPATFSSNLYYITPALVPASAISGQVFHFVAPSTNTGSATLRVGSLTGKTIVKISNSTLSSGDLQAGSLYSVVDDGTYYKLLNPQLGDLASLSTVTTSSYIASGAITLSNIAGAATGAVLTWNTERAAAVVTPGIIGQVLTSQGSTSVPVFQTVTSEVTRGTSITLGTLVASTSHVTGHNLSSRPDHLQAAYQNRTAECGYGPGDLIDIHSNDVQSAGANGININATTTQLRIVIGTNWTYLVTWPSGGACAATPANWGLFITPYKFNL